jgi:Tfp pilus assembly protein PilP
MILIGLLGLSFCGPVMAAEMKKEEPRKAGLGDFSFNSERMRDPFEAVYFQRIKGNKGTKAVVKTGFELDELKFVGTLKTDKGRSAMMEDMQGKGMLFKKGDYINGNLWVLEVLESRLVLGYKLKNEIKKMNIDIPNK